MPENKTDKTTHPSLCVFCGSKTANNPNFLEATKKLGAFCAQNNIRIIYGGANIGLMGALANSALEHQGSVIGIIPQSLEKKEIAHDHIEKLIITQSMHERQRKMAELSDAFLILPGGIGTLAEFFEVLTWKSLNIHNKPIILLNIDKFWDPLLDLLMQQQQEGFMHNELSSLFITINTIEDLHTLPSLLS